ncbi:MAG: HD domain-containing protein [Pseudomonadales bacterium]|nr:HD domain-containing protein [Pseudomonadales bacterium]
MDALKKYLVTNFEQFFILIILLSISSIISFIPLKLAFLNFFFLPVLLAAYYLDARTSILCSLFTVICVFLAASLYPQLFMPTSNNTYMLYTLLSWAGFLLLTGMIINFLHTRLNTKMNQYAQVSAELSGNKSLLRKTTEELDEYIQTLDLKVDQRTENLKKSSRAVEEHKLKVEEALFSTMDPVVAKLLIEKKLRTENRRISIQFADIKNFTRYSEENPAEVVVSRLNKHLENMEGSLLAYRAHIDKYLGDGIMSEFGAPNHYDQHALLAVIAGLKMQQTAVEGTNRWDLRIGIATGDAITGLVGHKRQSYTALGDTVNLASRIEGLCRPGKVTVDEATRHDTARLIDYKRVSVLASDGDESSPLYVQLMENLNRLEQQPENLELQLKTAATYLQLNDITSCHEQVKRILATQPDNEPAKLLYAEAAIKSEQLEDISIKGRQQTIHLYEAVGIKNPLYNREKIPLVLFDRYHQTVDQLISYPEDIILPIECIEASVGHSRVVGFIAYAIADQLNLADQDKQDILEAGYLADIGKSIIPHHLLNRCGQLNPEEFENIYKHPREAVRKLRQMGYESENVFEIIQNHHENYDGSGYPEGKNHREFSIGARIVALAEAYNSMTSWRPYRASWDRLAALEELRRFTDAGKYDPRVMEQMEYLLNSDASINPALDSNIAPNNNRHLNTGYNPSFNPSINPSIKADRNKTDRPGTKAGSPN